jgi:hypothetical protein
MELSLGSARSWLYGVVRNDPWLWRHALGARDIALRGPWRSAIVAYHRLRGATRTLLPTQFPTIFPDLDVEKTAEEIRANGYSPSLRVPDAVVDEIMAYCKTLSDKELNDHRDAHLLCPAIARVCYDERMVAVARAYLGVEPILFRTAAWVRFPFKGEPVFHFDAADIKDLLVFIYLSDVDEESMPHAVIPGTHNNKTLQQTMNRALPDEEAKRNYGARIKVVVGPRGTGFFEDTTCYHKRMGGTKTRYSLNLIYTLQRQPEA